ncbi:hypothetical protein [Bacillus horti]|uniref:Membrane protein SirB2 n=1 Tax=Caldalkalibacillus horti TaxID=77523 RepID=A0ABT9W3U6_9BACI|nr:hypothetical protein [Bacillus horti]MDQ0167795.1 putative membrane protein SirB2 [Bacillus horti]
MELLTWVFYVMLSAFLAAVVGFGLITRKVLLSYSHFIGLSLLLAISGYVSSYMGSWMGEFLSARILEIMLGIILMGCGIYLLKVKPIYPGYQDMLILFAVLFLEGCWISYRFGSLHSGSLSFVLFIMVMLSGGIAVGFLLGLRRWNHWRLTLILPQLSGALLVVVGFIKLF